MNDAQPHARFDEALVALDAGDLETLRALVTAEPSLVHARTNLDESHGYFMGATLLHHVAGNPDRGRLDGTRPSLPPNDADLARLLLEAGAGVDARTLGPRGGATTMGLVLASKQASDAKLSGPLIDALLEYGAHLEVDADDVLDGLLANHAPAAVEKLIALGAKVDVFAAAGLGRLAWLHGFFDGDGRLTKCPRRGGVEMSARDAIGLALLYAYVRQQTEAVDFLIEKDGNWNMVGVNNGTALHRAAWGGDLKMVQRLVAKGADVNIRDGTFDGTPLDWAEHNEQPEVAEWLRNHR